MWGLPANYKPAANPFAPKPDPQPEPIPDSVIQKARIARAQKISKDGQRVYDTRYGQIWIADWITEDMDFGAWRCEDAAKIPGDAIDICS